MLNSIDIFGKMYKCLYIKGSIDVKSMTYKQRMWALAALAIATSVPVGLVMGVLGRDIASPSNIWVVVPILILLFAVQFIAVWPWWKRLDDLQKQAHLTSWYWGGMSGAVLWVIWLVANKMHHTDFGMGAVAMFSAQFAGFCVYYLFWWIRGRGPAE